MPTPVFDEIKPPKPSSNRPGQEKLDFATMLSRIYQLADQAITQLENGVTSNNEELDEARIKALTNHITALNRMARILPLLNQAEQSTQVRDKEGREVSDWADDELLAEVAKIKGRPL